MEGNLRQRINNSMQRNSKLLECSRVIYLVLISFFTSLLSGQSFFSKSIPGTDSSVFITIARNMLAGKTPYRDYFDHKGPYLYVLNCIGYAIGKIQGIWIVEFISISIAIIFIYATIKKVGGVTWNAMCSTTICCIVLCVCIGDGNLTEEYALPLISIALYLAISAIQTKHILWWQIAILGFTFGLSLMLRPNMFAVWFVFSLYWLIYCFVQKRIDKAMQYVLFFAIGTIISLLPFVIYLWINNALYDYIFQNFIFNFLYVKDGGGLLAVLKTLLTGIKKYILVFFVLLSLIVSIIGILSKKDKENRTIYFFVFVLLVISSILVASSKTIRVHYFMVFVPVVSIAVSKLFFDIVFLAEKCNIHRSWMKVILLGISVCLLLAEVLIIRKDMRNNVDNEVYVVAESLNGFAKEGDTIQVLGNKCAIYLYTDVRPASKFIYDQPITEVSQEVHKQFVQIWEQKRPSFVVSTKYYSDNESEHVKWVASELEKNYTVIYETNNYVLYQYGGI